MFFKRVKNCIHKCKRHRKEFIVQEELTLINLINQKNVWFVISGFLEIKTFNFEKLIHNGCHNISMMRYELEQIAIFKLKNVDYRCTVWNMTYDKAFNLLNKSTLDKRGLL